MFKKPVLHGFHTNAFELLLTVVAKELWLNIGIMIANLLCTFHPIIKPVHAVLS